MAGVPRKFIAALYRHGAESAENKEQLVAWKGEALAAIAENKGGSPVSGSANGVSFAFGADGLTNADWFSSLDAALVYIDQGIAPPSVTFARIL